MGDPSVVCKSLGGTAGGSGSCVLSPPAENDDLKDWDYILNFRPLAVKSNVKARFPDTPCPDGYHAIEDGMGPVNLDFYPIQITKLPVIGGTQIQPEAYVKYIRQHLSQYVDPNIAIFNPYDDTVDGPPWRSDNPVGTVININFPRMVYAAGVVAAESTSAYWIFSTLWTPDTHNHPVSGNRQFGYAVLKAGQTLSPVYQKAGVGFANADQDAVYIFTRGADRCTSTKYWVQSDDTFAGGHACWLSFQQKVLADVFASGGAGFVPGCVSERWDWDGIQKAGYLWHNPPR
jgi:hypothetical protein